MKYYIIKQKGGCVECTENFVKCVSDLKIQIATENKKIGDGMCITHFLQAIYLITNENENYV